MVRGLELYVHAPGFKPLTRFDCGSRMQVDGMVSFDIGSCRIFPNLSAIEFDIP